MEEASTLVDLIIAVLQSLVVLLLASGFYVALAVRKSGDAPTEPDRPRGPRGVTATRPDSAGL
jgi:hypothetical protein